MQSCRYWPTQEDVRLTRSVLGPDALPPLPRPIPPPHPGPPIAHRPGFPCHVRGRRTQPGPGHNRPGWGTAAGPGPENPGALHSAAGAARPDTLVVLTVWHVMAGSAGHAHLPGWVCPRGRHTPKGSPKLAATKAAGDQKAVTGIPAPEIGRPGRCGHRDPAYRPAMPGPGVGATVLRVATQPPPTGAH